MVAGGGGDRYERRRRRAKEEPEESYAARRGVCFSFASATELSSSSSFAPRSKPMNRAKNALVRLGDARDESHRAVPSSLRSRHRYDTARVAAPSRRRRSPILDTAVRGRLSYCMVI